MSRRQIHIRRTASDLSGRIVVGPPKTPKSRRTVVLPRFVVEELSTHLREMGANTPTDLIFPAPERGSIRRRTNWTRRFWKPALERAGLEMDLGHTFAAALPGRTADRSGGALESKSGPTWDIVRSAPCSTPIAPFRGCRRGGCGEAASKSRPQRVQGVAVGIPTPEDVQH